MHKMTSDLKIAVATSIYEKKKQAKTIMPRSYIEPF